MDQPFLVEIRVEGRLGDQWSDWLQGLAIQVDPTGETMLCGPLPDQAALLGVLNKIHSLNLSLISVTRIKMGAR